MPIPSTYRTALVTGASRGIGAEITRKLIGEGLTVYAVARTAEALDDISQLPRVIPLICDITQTETLSPALEGLEIDVLVNNAGAVGSVKPLTEQSLAETTETISLNLTAPLHLMQILVPGMIDRGYGHVISLSSSAGHAVFPGTAVYAASKAALSHAHEVMRYDMAGRNIRFTEIAPGRVATEFYLRAFGGDAKKMNEALYDQPRALSTHDVADTVIMALSMSERADIARLDVSPTDQATGGHVFPLPNQQNKF